MVRLSRPMIVMYTRQSCENTDAIRARLQEAEVMLQEVDIDADEMGAEYVRSVNRGEEITPTLLFGSGLHRLSRPSLEELEEALRRVGYLS